MSGDQDVMCADGCTGCSAECAACASGCFGCGGCDSARLAVMELTARSARKLLPVLAFDPDQPRDADGQWSDGVPGGAGAWNLPKFDGDVTFPGSSKPAAEEKAAWNAAPSPKEAAEKMSDKKAAATVEETAKEYVKHLHERINTQLRRGPNNALYEGERADLRAMDAAIAASPLTEDVVLYRGMRRGGLVFGPAALKGSVVGAEWTEKGYSSTSANPKVAAKSFAGDVYPGETRIVMRLLAPKGTGGLRLDKYGYEAEVLLGRGSRFRVVADHGDVKGIRRIDVEVLPDTNPDKL